MAQQMRDEGGRCMGRPVQKRELSLEGPRPKERTSLSEDGRKRELRKEGIEERGRRGSIPAGFSAGVNPARVQDSVQSC